MSLEDEELEEIQRRKMLELRKRLAEERRKAAIKQEFEIQKQTMLRKILTQEARQRLERIRLVKPEFVEQLELQLIQIAQGGQVNLPITDEQLKAILTRLQSNRREIRIRRR